MIYYLNRSLIAEQALVAIIKKYFSQLNFSNLYENFNLKITNEHPFGQLIYNGNSNNADNFPCIVVTTATENKVTELNNLRPQVNYCSFTSADIDEIIENSKTKTKINCSGEEVAEIKKNGEVKTETIPGYSIVVDDKRIQALKDHADSNGYVYGINTISKRSDNISIEIWAENNQIKNEIYEQLRNLLATNINNLLNIDYAAFEPFIPDNTVRGERSNNFNYDFGIVLHGARISLSIDYFISQIILDTEINNIDYNIVTDVLNHVREN